MLGPADLDAWDDDVRIALVAELCRGGWDRPGREAPTLRGARLLTRFREGQTLSTGELNELRNALFRA